MIVAEVVWCMRVVVSNYSYNSNLCFLCFYIRDFFFGRNKVLYVMLDGLGLYF